MILLSIDSGLEKTGYAIFEHSSREPEYIDSGLVKTSKNQNNQERILKIYEEVKTVIKKYSPQVIVIERLLFFRNQKTVISVGQTQGVILLLAAENKLRTEFLTPLQIKQIVTGYGQSDKKSVRKMVELTVKIKKTIKEDDEIDAIACGLAYCYLYRTG